MFNKLKTDELSVEIRLWEFETIDTGAFVGGYPIPGKKMVHTLVPQYTKSHMTALEECYYSCIKAVALGPNMCRSLTIPLLGTEKEGWSADDSMRCAWKAILRYAEETSAGFAGMDRLRRIVITCNEKDYAAAKVYRKNMGHLFFRVPEQWNHHGDLFLWNYLQKELAQFVVTEKIPSAIGALRMTNKIISSMTPRGLQRGKTIQVFNDKYFGKLAGMPINSDFWLDILIPLMLENFCIHYDELGFPPMETIEVLIGNYTWTIPKDCEYYFTNMVGGKLFLLKNVSAEENKLTLKDVGLQYSPAVEKALRICFDAHKGQTDNSGLPYVFHPFHLAEQMETEYEICTALLHDVVEDSSYTIANLIEAGFNRKVTEAVALLTHDLSIPYMQYIRMIRNNKVARKVKLADLTHNSDPKRKAIETEWEKRRAGKYRIAKSILENDWYDRTMGHYRKRIPLDDKRLYFLSVFYDTDGIVHKYSLDVETASDSHTEFGPGAVQVIKKALGTADSLPEALSVYFEDHSLGDFHSLLAQCKIGYNVFQYGD